MNKGIIYVMTTSVSGLIKIGRTGTDNFKQRMRLLEANGYYNVSGLKKFFAIELNDYESKEKLLHEIFGDHQVGNSELFALDQELVRELLLSYDGKTVYPEGINKEEEFDEVTEARKISALFSFYDKAISNGEQIRFIFDKQISATVVGEREVEYGGQIWKLSPLTYKIYQDKNQLNKSGAYRGAEHWEYKGKKLKDINNII